MSSGSPTALPHRTRSCAFHTRRLANEEQDTAFRVTEEGQCKNAALFSADFMYRGSQNPPPHAGAPPPRVSPWRDSVSARGLFRAQEKARLSGQRTAARLLYSRKVMKAYVLPVGPGVLP